MPPEVVLLQPRTYLSHEANAAKNYNPPAGVRRQDVAWALNETIGCNADWKGGVRCNYDQTVTRDGAPDSKHWLAAYKVNFGIDSTGSGVRHHASIKCTCNLINFRN